jgi:hypothetical protein
MRCNHLHDFENEAMFQHDEREEKVNKENDDEGGYCLNCSGSGEGMYDGSRCSSCKGSGVGR